MCHKEKDAGLFPFKSRSECYLCYEKVEGVTLHSFRGQISRGGIGVVTQIAKAATKSKPHRKVIRQEIGMDDIYWYLEQQYRNGRPIHIYYKEDKDYRTFYEFTYDETYLRIPASAGGYNILYRIDRIRNVGPYN